MNRKFEIVLDECLDWLQAGASVEDCLARHPEHTEALGPLLSLASAVRTVPYPRSKPAAMVAGRQMMLRAVAEKKARQPFPGGLRARSLARVALSFAVLILVVGLSARGFVAVAADSLPGDNLYPVKRFAENVRLALTSDPVVRQQLRSEFAQEREEEVRAVLDSDRAATVEFSGFLQELGDRFWRVS